MSMLEAAVDLDHRISTLIPKRDSAALTEVRTLLGRHGLGLDDDIDLFVTAHEGTRLIACLGLAGGIMKCAASDPAAQGTGVMARLVTRLTVEAADRGRTHLFAFTKPRNREIFESLGFTTLAEVPDAILLENTPFGLDTYLRTLRKRRLPGERIGSMVLNANPFTLGHRYLVETAAAECDALHVFVVSEDASLFPADVRLRLVEEGIAELGLPHVVVHPGSRYIVSRATFPRYFLAKNARAAAAAGLDLQLFRNAIAPSLKITDRFVGSEPLSPVTAAYNDEMRYWLTEAPCDGPALHVHELRRIERGDQPISASRVRAAIERRDADTISALVPTPTRDYIMENFFSQEDACASSKKP